MTTTYKDLTPGEALDALIRGEKVDAAADDDDDWSGITRTWGFSALEERHEKWRYRLVIEPKPETVEEALDAYASDTRIGNMAFMKGWLRIFAALKREIKAELREEMKR